MMTFVINSIGHTIYSNNVSGSEAKLTLTLGIDGYIEQGESIGHTWIAVTYCLAATYGACGLWRHLPVLPGITGCSNDSLP